MSTIDHILTPGNFLDGYQAKSEGASVRGYAHALEEELKRIQKEGLSLFTVDLVSRLHKQTMGQDPRFRGIAGSLRSEPRDMVCISGPTRRLEDSIYNPAPPRHVRRCLEETMSWYGDSKFVAQGNAGMGMPLLIRMAVGHAHFEAVHPFSDGNGRVGRMLMTLQMACDGKIPIYLSGYIEEEKQEYYRSLQEAQKKLNYNPLIEFFAHSLIASSQEAKLTRDHIEELPTTWLKRGKFRKNSTAERALPWLMTQPIFTAKQLEEQLTVSPQAANTAVELLCKHEVVRERTGYERNRIYAAEEVISLLSRRFGSDPQEALDGARNLIKTSLQPD